MNKRWQKTINIVRNVIGALDNVSEIIYIPHPISYQVLPRDMLNVQVFAIPR